MSGETGENPVRARRRKIQKRTSYQMPRFGKQPLEKSEKVDEPVLSRNIRTNYFSESELREPVVREKKQKNQRRKTYENET